MVKVIIATVVLGALVFAGVAFTKTTKKDTTQSQQVIGTETVNTTTQETGTPANESNGITLDEVALHNSKSDCWTSIEGNVYDVTSYIGRHPGGSHILQACGIDASSLFNGMPGPHIHSQIARALLKNMKIGTLSQ